MKPTPLTTLPSRIDPFHYLPPLQKHRGIYFFQKTAMTHNDFVIIGTRNKNLLFTFSRTDYHVHITPVLKVMCDYPCPMTCQKILHICTRFFLNLSLKTLRNLFLGEMQWQRRLSQCHFSVAIIVRENIVILQLWTAWTKNNNVLT